MDRKVQEAGELSSVLLQKDIELWADVCGYEGLYKVSSLGRLVGPSGKTLKPRNNGNGYNYACLYSEGKPKYFGVHRLVAGAFIPNPSKKPNVNHIDANRFNNHISNLEWCTQSENAKHTLEMGRTTTGVKNAMAKVTEEDVTYIRENYCKSKTKNGSGGGNLYKLARQFSINPASVLNIVKRVTWKHV